MPSLQTVDLSPTPRTRETTLEQTLGAFSNRMSQNQAQRQDTDALSSIYAQYKQDGENLSNTLRAVQTNPNLSPSARVSTIDQLLKFQQHNAQLQKTAQKQQEAKAKAEQAQRDVEDSEAQTAYIEEQRGLAPGSLKAFKGKPELAERLTNPGKKTQASQPIDEDQWKRIEHTRKQPGFNELSPDEQNLAFLGNGVSKENSAAIIKPRIDQAKIDAKEKANSPEAEFAKGAGAAARKYVQNAIQAKEEAREERFALDEVRKAIRGKVAGPGFEALIKNNPYGQLMMGLTPDESLLQAANKKLLGSMSKGTFGTKPTEREIFLLLNSMLPSIGKTLEANEASLEFMDKVNAMKERHADLVMELTEGGTKYVAGLEDKIEKMMEPAAQALKKELEEANEKYNKPAGQNKTKKDGKILVKDPEGGRWRMTLDQIENAAEQGAFFEPVQEPA